MKRLLLGLLVASCALAQGVVTIQSSPPYVSANGTLLNGSASIAWQSFTTALGTVVPAGALNVPIASGVFTIPVALYPNVGANPPGTSYTVQYNFSGSPVYERNWYIPASSIPVTVVTVEFPPQGLVGMTAIVSPSQLTQAGATVNQPLCWNGAMWAPGNCGGGSTAPGGAQYSIQINSGSGSFSGLASLGTTTTVLHGNPSGPPTFGQVVTGDIATGAVTLTSQVNGVLPVANGGTGTSTPFTLGSVVFAGPGGMFQQDNSNFFYNSGTRVLGIGPSSPAFTSLAPIGAEVLANNAGLYFVNSNASAIVRAVTADNTTASSIHIGSTANPSATGLALDVNGATSVSIPGATGDVLVCAGSDGGFRLDVQCSGTTGTARIWDQTASGVTQIQVRNGANQSSIAPFVVLNNGGTALAYIDSVGDLVGPTMISQTGASVGSVVNGAVGFGFLLSNNRGISWSSTTQWFGSEDTSISRLSAGVVAIGTTSTSGDFSGSLKLTGLTIAGITGSTQCLQVNTTGAVSGTGSACGGGGGGSGTVTNTLGPLTAGHVMVGNGGNDSTVIASLGATTTVLHGNAGGNPAFSAVVLTTDVSGVLPLANGGTGLSSNFTNHQFFGNNSGSTAAPIATQPTFADLAAGTVGARGTFPGGDLFIGGVNAQSGTSYTIATTDENTLVTFNNASAVAVTLPVATTTGFTAGAFFPLYNRGAGAVTVTPTTSTINGGSTIVLNQGQGAWIVSDSADTNYSAWVSAAPSGSGTLTNVATTGPITGGPITTTGTIACPTCTTSAASLTANQLLIGAGSQGMAALGSLGTTHTVYHGNAAGAGSFGAVVLTTDVSGVLPAANLPTATSSALGIVQGDASTITLTAGVISATTATTSQLGVVKPDGTTITISGGVISSVGSGGGGAAAVLHSVSYSSTVALSCSSSSADTVDTFVVAQLSGNITFTVSGCTNGQTVVVDLQQSASAIWQPTWSTGFIAGCGISQTPGAHTIQSFTIESGGATPSAPCTALSGPGWLNEISRGGIGTPSVGTEAQGIDSTSEIPFSKNHGGVFRVEVAEGSGVRKANGANTDDTFLGLQGTDTSIMTAGAVSGTSAPLCTDSNGGATTVSCPGSGTLHSQFYPFAFNNTASQCIQAVNSPSTSGLSGCTAATPADFGENIGFTASATGYVTIAIDLRSWNSGTLALDLYGASDNISGSGTVFYNVSTGCQSFGSSGTSPTPTYNTAQASSSYNAPSFSQNIYRLSISSLTTTGCTAGQGNLLTLKIVRQGTDTNASQLFGATITGVF